MPYLTLVRGATNMSATRVVSGGVVGRLFALGGGFDGAIDLDQDEARRVVDLLDHVEAGDARLLHAVTAVFDGRLAKRLDNSGLTWTWT